MEEDRDLANIGPSCSDVALSNDTRQPRRRFVGQRAAAEQAASKPGASQVDGSAATSSLLRASQRMPRLLNQIPRDILEDSALRSAMAHLPPNYSFEIPKTIHRIRASKAKNVALQFPEGLLLFAPLISDILTSFCPGTETLIMGDVTYGACCVDDFTARALGCDLLVHYGHSCLVPMDQTGGVQTLYVFVTIGIDEDHLVRTIEANFQGGQKIALVGTIQFNSTLHSIVPRLRTLGFDALLPRSSPLSAGEILGCTAPTLSAKESDAAKKQGCAAAHTADLILYVGDGRFHLESILIASPSLRAHTYRYDPYSRRLTHETYAHAEMHHLRRNAIRAAEKTLAVARTARRSTSTAGKMPFTWGIILGTLGRQGNPHTLALIIAHLERLDIPYVSMLLSEIQPSKLSHMSHDVGIWVQIACPRLSIDWGYAFERPLLSPYEAMVALGICDADWLERAEHSGFSSEERTRRIRPPDQVASAVYPMDFYSKDGLGRTKPGDIPAPLVEASQSIPV